MGQFFFACMWFLCWSIVETNFRCYSDGGLQVLACLGCDTAFCGSVGSNSATCCQSCYHHPKRSYSVEKRKASTESTRIFCRTFEVDCKSSRLLLFLEASVLTRLILIVHPGVQTPCIFRWMISYLSWTQGLLGNSPQVSQLLWGWPAVSRWSCSVWCKGLDYSGQIGRDCGI